MNDKWLQRDSNPQPLNRKTNTQPFSEIWQMNNAYLKNILLIFNTCVDFFHKIEFFIRTFCSVFGRWTSAQVRSSRLKVFCKKVFLEVSQNLQKPQACNFIKKETLAHVLSCEFCEISKSIFFHRTPLVAAFHSHQKLSLLGFLFKSCNMLTT